MESVRIGEFELLNDEKVSRALDKLGANASEASILAEYDRLGGAIKKDGRKLITGTFFDFKTQKPKEKIEFDESVFDDEYVLVHKPKQAANSRDEVRERLKKLKTAPKEEIEEAEKEEEIEEEKLDESEPAPKTIKRRGRPKKV